MSLSESDTCFKNIISSILYAQKGSGYGLVIVCKACIQILQLISHFCEQKYQTK